MLFRSYVSYTLEDIGPLLLYNSEVGYVAIGVIADTNSISDCGVSSASNQLLRRSPWIIRISISVNYDFLNTQTVVWYRPIIHHNCSPVSIVSSVIFIR